MKKYLLINILLCLPFIFCDQAFNPQTTPPSEDTEYHHNSNITENETWKADAPHIIEAELYVQQAILKIESGAIVQFKQGAALNIMEAGGIIAEGKDSPIIFTPLNGEQNNWKYIFFGDNALDDSCRLVNCKFFYGGSDPRWPATVYCRQAAPTIINCEIRNSASHGLYLAGNCTSITLLNNTITQNANAPIATSACNVPFIGAGNYQGNSINYIKIIDGEITCDANWQLFEIPYYIEDNLNIKNATLTISTNANIVFGSKKRLAIYENSKLIARGVNFTGLVTSRGFWNGIYFANFSTAELQNCTIEYGGGDADFPANIFIDHANPHINLCTIKNSSQYGIFITGNYTKELFTNNTIISNGNAPVSIPANLTLDFDSNNFNNNGQNYIEMRGGPEEGAIEETTTWQPTGNSLHYHLTDYLTIRMATLHIGAGVKIELENGVHIDVMQGGSLIADGSSGLITFTSNTKYPGSWNGIYFSEYCDDDNSFLKHCLIEYGGGDNSRPANIYCDNASPTITNCYIENSLGYGIYLAGNANPTLENNSFNNNLSGSIFP